jgi:putative protease
MKQRGRKIELLAPARDAQIAIEAIRHGADAVYMGASAFGARASAGNALDEVARAVDFAHQFNARIYATVNTLVYDHELKQVERLIADLYHIGVDAIIVQDMGILRLDLPPIALHASTQCDLRTPEKARFLESVGFSQLVLARELSLDEVRSISQSVQVPIEAFVHGALCVSYSGRCQVSEMVKGRSANRGECAQMCRLSYDLEDGEGHKLMQGKHLLSLCDLNMSSRLAAMLEAGVSSFKIEGRLKDVGYVKNVVAYYRRALDRIIAASEGALERSSCGTSVFSFEPDVAKSFNRSFTTYFADAHHLPNGHSMASVHTPKSMGEPLGKARNVRGKTLEIDTRKPLANGDGLSFVNARGEYEGFRVNVANGNRVVLNDEVHIPAGAMIYRTHDKAMNDILAKPSAERRISVDARLLRLDCGIALTLSDERGNRVTHRLDSDAIQPAQSPQADKQRQVLAKLGNTIYELHEAELLDGCFIPSSLLTRLRREAIELLDRAQRLTYRRDVRRPEDRTAPCFATELASADNVANHLAEEFYRDHGVERITPAIEVQKPAGNEPVPVMHTRYCLRRELGACLKGPRASALPRRLYLRYGTTRLQVQCHCDTCEMTLHLT